MTAAAMGALWALLSGWWVAEHMHRRTVRARHHPFDGQRDRTLAVLPSARVTRLAIAAGLAGVLALLHPVLVPLPVLAAMALPRLRERRARMGREAALVDELPDVVDLLGLTTAAGLPVSAAIRSLAGRPGGLLGPALAGAAACLAHGGATADALAVLSAQSGEPVRRLVDALADHDRYGTPLGPVLDRVAVEARLTRRRRAEQAAQRLPVSLLFPLVLTVLPAFLLLVVVPLLAGSLTALEL